MTGKAIMAANLGFNPRNDGEVLRIQVPPLTEERRKELAKTIHKKGEDAKVAVRSVRRDANDTFKKDKKSSAITEDDLTDLEREIQEATDNHTKTIDTLVADKEAEIMEV